MLDVAGSTLVDDVARSHVERYKAAARVGTRLYAPRQLWEACLNRTDDHWLELGNQVAVYEHLDRELGAVLHVQGRLEVNAIVARAPGHQKADRDESP